jgi:hypothetical protein
MSVKSVATPVKVPEPENTKKDAWSMGKGLVNLGNLKEPIQLDS